MDSLRLIGGAVAILGFIGLFVAVKTGQQALFPISVYGGLGGGALYLVASRVQSSRRKKQ